MKKFQFKNIDLRKKTVAFTWDDNFESHYKIIAPIFMDFDLRCTFYINPGEEEFNEKHFNGYKQISELGFEIGSHGYTHHHFSKLTQENFIYQLSESNKCIQALLSTTPSTFAFPHHDFTIDMLELTKKVYFETRNTLTNSKRFSLKSNTDPQSITEVLTDLHNNKYDLIFSGHGVYVKTLNISECGYEPISIRTLVKILEIISSCSNIQVCTFEQACLKSYISVNCNYTIDYCFLTDDDLLFLQQFGLTKERIMQII